MTTTMIRALPLRMREAQQRDGRVWRLIAEQSGYSLSYIRRVLSKHHYNPTLGFVEAMAGTLNVCPYWLLGKDANDPIQ